MTEIYSEVNWQKYLNTDRERRTTRKQDQDHRNEFESDLGRVIFSPALRRMHDKAQVIPLTSGDSIHTRLTHSMEVMSIAYSLGIELCRNEAFKKAYTADGDPLFYEQRIPIILKTAALAHDIGNPPFGHFGETIIQKYFREYFEDKGQILTEEEKADFTEFDGNAQGFRILTRLQYLGDLNGLNLTYATLGAYTKYPNSGKRQKDNYIGLKKHGVFTTESSVLENLAKKCGMIMDGNTYIKRHPLSFLVEAADSICYNIMDVEDGVNKKWFTYDSVIEELNTYIRDHIGVDDKYKEFFDLQALVGLKISKNDDESEKKKMVNFRICVINYFVKLAIKNFINNLKDIDDGKYTEELIEDDFFYVSKAFQNFAKKHIYTQKAIQEIELTGVSVITGIFKYLIDYVFSTDEQYRRRAKSIISRNCLKVVMHEEKAKEEQEKGKYYFSDDEIADFDLDRLSTRSKLRMIVDFVSGMTDKYAVSLYRQLNGQQLRSSIY